MEKYKNKYRIPSSRLQHWDYRWAGAYFITICTKDRRHYFGEIKNEMMVLSNVGVLADVFWHEIKNHTQNVQLGAFVVMPNHIHGILMLRDNVADYGNAETLRDNVADYGNAETLRDTVADYGNAETLRDTVADYGNAETLRDNVADYGNAETLRATVADYGNAETLRATSLRPMIEKNERMAGISPKSGAISTVIRSYKSAVTKHSNRLGFDFGWQARFYDHIIRDEKSFETISNYIINNPLNWEKDKFCNER